MEVYIIELNEGIRTRIKRSTLSISRENFREGRSDQKACNVVCFENAWDKEALVSKCFCLLLLYKVAFVHVAGSLCIQLTKLVLHV